MTDAITGISMQAKHWGKHSLHLDGAEGRLPIAEV